MDPSFWLILIFIITIIIFILIGILWTSNEPTLPEPDIPAFQQQYTSLATWGGATSGPDPTRNTCHLYTFPGQMAGMTAIPGQPSLNSNIINGLVPQTATSCVDIDQLVVAQQQHMCNGPTGSVSWCYESNGTLATPGQIEVYYSTSNCSSQPCSGTLAVTSLWFNPPYSYMCLVKGQSGNTGVSLTSCNLSQESQLWRVIRTVPGATAAPPPGTSNGNILKILDRDTNLCLMPAAGVTTTPPNNTNVILANCGQKQGNVWMLTPPISGVLNGINYQAPGQICYIGGIPNQNIPQTFTSFQQFYDFININQVKSLAMMPGLPTVTLKPYWWWINTTPISPGDPGYFQSAQYLDYNLYNILLQIPPS